MSVLLPVGLVIGAAVAVLFGGHAAFRRGARKETHAFLTPARDEARVIVTEEMLQGLPALVCNGGKQPDG
ncbi:MAG: hypothetical protein QN117_02005 [Armatimonadota bacterium]|nr:hypothetical protein [Armatimonadota bacterium]MDR7466134.1 hypothetical protein [Armatimonadota bacterium]MDR7546149.1 hypothetical protein [Armatimonadota bacterium]MDR7551749.1 hypothetical protein [Armatimonadota bacterium]